MAKPKSNFISKTLTMHPAVKDIVAEFSKEESKKAKINELKNINIAVITEKYRDFRVYVLENEATGNNQNFIHVSRLNEIEGIQWNDYVKLSTRFKMPNIDEIVKEVIKKIDNQ